MSSDKSCNANPTDEMKVDNVMIMGCLFTFTSLLVIST